MPKAIAVACSDIHLRETPPPARAGEPDWYAAMGRPLLEMELLAANLNVPILCAGDIFDKPNPSPELVNFAIEHLPRMYAVPGQHDLLYHNLADIKKTAYHTLILADKIKNVEPYGIRRVRKFCLAGYPWGVDLAATPQDDDIKIALCHHYIWIHGNNHPGAKQEDYYDTIRSKMSGYTFLVFGDNHRGFYAKQKGLPTVVNNGGFMRWKSDEYDRLPCCYILYDDGDCKPYYFTIKDEVFANTQEEREAAKCIERLSETLENLGGLFDFENDQDEAMDFKEALLGSMRAAAEKLSPAARNFILEAMG